MGTVSSAPWRGSRTRTRRSPAAEQSATTEYGTATPSNSDFPFRIRQIRFRPATSSASAPTAVAVTSGCCYRMPGTTQDDPTVDFPRLLAFDGHSWHVGGLY